MNTDQTREEMIADFRKWLQEHKEEITIVKPEDIPDDEWEDWEG